MKRLCPTEPLTRRELQALSLVGCGLTQSQAAARLGWSPRTVSSDMASVRAKLRVDCNTEAVRIALAAGLIPVGVVSR